MLKPANMIANEAHHDTVHNQIGFMAETFFTPETTQTLARLLEPQYNGSVGRAAAWVRNEIQGQATRTRLIS